MGFIFFLIILALRGGIIFVKGIKFSAESFSEISLLAKEGKVHLESLREKANVPQYGSCWTNAISDLQIGCKFLSENVQSDLALRFTDCFLQMSGHEPVNCDFPRSVCLKKLSDRAFNAYTEFYTHTQSICYFLQSQLWHEEAEKTIEKLSSTSRQVSQKLKDAEKAQEKLLSQQKESLFLQHDLMSNSKNVASALESSQEKINNIMSDFQNSATEQRQLLLDLFENLLSLKSWAMDEMSWVSSMIFFMAATILGFLFTSISRTRGARMFVFIIFTLNFFFERFLTSNAVPDNVSYSRFPITMESLNSWIWLCRKVCVSLSAIIILYTALNYYDYDLLNYQLLLEIKNQNKKILDYFALQANNNSSNQLKNSKSFNHQSNSLNRWKNNPVSVHSVHRTNQFNENLNQTYLNGSSGRNSIYYSPDVVDHSENENEDNISITSEKLNSSQEVRTMYNLRSKKNSLV